MFAFFKSRGAYTPLYTIEKYTICSIEITWRGSQYEAAHTARVRPFSPLGVKRSCLSISMNLTLASPDSPSRQAEEPAIDLAAFREWTLVLDK